MPDVVVVGDTAWDTVVRLATDLMFDNDVPAAIRTGPGGQGLNIAVTARREGAETALVTQVGTDEHSRYLTAWLESQGIDLPVLTRTEPLTHVVALVQKDGERALLTDPGSGPLGDPVPWLHAGVLVVSGYLAERADGVRKLRSWMKWGRNQGMVVMLDPAHRRIGSRLQAVIGYADWLITNEVEWEALGKPCHAGVLLKRGANGIQLMDGHDTWSIASPAGAIIDTTGAGDAVAGAFAARIAQGERPVEAAHRAAECGVKACGRMGAV